MTERHKRPVAIVTGGTSGIGEAIVKELAKTHFVYALGRSEQALAKLNQQENSRGVQLELTDPQALKQFIETVPEFNVLVHAAAIADKLSIEQATPDLWQKQFATNVFAPAELTRLSLPALRKSHGQIVFINSGSGTLALEGHAVYSASKFALHAIAHALRKEESANGIRVATVAPGPTDTPLNPRPETADPLSFSKPSSVAAAVRLIVDATEETQITDIAVRPRHDPAKR